MMISTFVRCKTVLQIIVLLSLSCSFADNIAKKGKVIRRNIPFVVLVCSYNNEKYVDKNLDSIFSQSHKNFRVIYIDDSSTDRTRSVVKKKLREKKHPCRFQYFRNSSNKGCMANTVQAVEWCRNWEVVVILDGDDWFAHRDVLASLNGYYQNDHIWLTYGQYKEYPSGKLGINRPCSKDELRGAKLRRREWKTTHQRTFYAGLFKRIHHRDLKYKGKYIDVASDQAFMLPMIDMAREHAYFIPEVLYVYNKENEISDFKQKAKMQLKMREYIRRLPVYPALQIDPRRG